MKSIVLLTALTLSNFSYAGPTFEQSDYTCPQMACVAIGGALAFGTSIVLYQQAGF